ncbi:MAG TPA: glycosyl transferase family 1, partial [Planctomycetaceae bacterium]|nr:glycosyl transferase family 1 [Planctomycetaceae bacterium]
MLSYLPFLIGLAVAAAVMPLTIWVSRRLGMLDKPEARKVHTQPTPRLGGVAIFAGVLGGTIGTTVTKYLLGEPIDWDVIEKFSAILAAGAFVFLVGVVDDLRSVSSRFKLITLIATSATACGAGIVLSRFTLAGEVFIQFPFWVGWFATMLWVIAVAVSINFIDGLDGLAGSLMTLAVGVLSINLLTNGQADAAILPLALTGALIGFLFFNWHPAKSFMGDSGSLTIGFLFAVSTVYGNTLIGTKRGFILPALAISIPLADAVLTFFRRHYQQRRSIFSAERGHIHHRLLDRGLTHRSAVVALLVVSVIAVGIGYYSYTFDGWATLGGFALLVPLLWGVFQLAGSVRTTEMLQAFRSKRDSDRVNHRYRSACEDLLLQFDQVTNFGQWWDAMCRGAERLDFVKLTITIPQPQGDDTKLDWENPNSSLGIKDSIQAAIPILVTTPAAATATANVTIAMEKSPESAVQRLQLFTRLLTEHSLANLRRKEKKAKSKTLALSPSTADEDPYAPLLRVDKAADGQFAPLKIAIVHDFLYTYAGAERVVEQLIAAFPHCDLFALFDFLPESQRGFLRDKPVTTSFIQRLPFASRKHRAYLPLMPLAIEQLDVSRYDLVISSSALVAKGVITGPDQLHVCYCYSPARYAWDLHHQYLNSAGLGFGPKGMLARAILHYLRIWDVRTANSVDHFIAISKFITRRIKKIYRRRSVVIYPPVSVDPANLNSEQREGFYLVVGRMVPYKLTDLIVAA